MCMKVGNIETSEISVVVQGAIDKINTPLCLNSIRKYLPGSEIILSTWEGADVTNLEYDIVLFNKDPGGFTDRFIATFMNNTVRQIYSTQMGLKKASKKFTLKLRSDLILNKNKFLNMFDAYPKRDENYVLFKHRVLVTSFFSKKFLYSNGLIQPVPFHISDWALFGYSEDINRIFNIELPKEPDFSWYLYENKINTVKTNLLCGSHKYAPEQYITLSAFKNAYDINFEHYMDYSDKNIELSEKLIANNYIIISPRDFSFYCGKKRNNNDFYKRWSKYPFTIPKLLWEGLYRPYVFALDYKKYCDNNYQLPKKMIWMNKFDSYLHKR